MQYEGDNMMGIKRSNRSAALRILHERGNISRKRLAESIKLTPAAITKIIGEMIAEGLVVEGSTIPSGGAGRREVMVILNTMSRCALGVQLKKGSAIVSAVWLDGSVIFSEELSLPSPASADDTMKAVSNRLHALCSDNNISRSIIVGLGLCVDGKTDRDCRVLCGADILDAEDYPICDKLEELLNLPVVMANRVNSVFAAHMFLSRDRSLTSQFFVHCDDSISASLFMNGQVCDGAFQRCAELGHIPVVRRGGKPCSCGKCGCLETVASPAAIREEALAALSHENTPILWNTLKGKNPQELGLENIFDAARYGDQGVADIVDRAVYEMASALKSVIYIVDPGKIVFYGEIFENPYYLSKLLAEIREGVDSGHGVSVEKSAHNCTLERSAAGILAVEEFFARGGAK